MKWVKVAIGAVIAVSVIPMIVSVINNLSEVSGYKGEMELVINNDNIVEMYDLLLEIVEIDDTNEVINAINGYHYNSNEYEYDSFIYDSELNRFEIMDSNYDLTVYVGPNETLLYGELTLTILADTLEVVSDVPPTVYFLLSLIPLIFTSGILFNIYKLKRE